MTGQNTSILYYSQARAYIKDADVLTWAGTWPMSRAIRWATGQDVSHVGFAVWMKYERSRRYRLCVFQAMEGRGVELVPITHTFGHGKVYWQQLKPGINRAKVLAYAFSQWGEKYASAYQFILGMCPHLAKLRKFCGRSLTLDGEERWHCSKLIAKSIINGGYPYEGEVGLVTPGDISSFSCLQQRRELVYP